MKRNPLSRTQKILTALTAAAVCLAVAVIIFLYFFPEERRNDYRKLSSESYDAVFLSMYPIDHFYEEDFAYWRGMNMVKASYELPDFATLKGYLKRIGESGNPVHTIYLGVLPEELPSAELAMLLQSYPGIHFEIILPNPSLEYWLALSDTECTDRLNAYRDFILPLLSYENMSLYYFGATEWLISNPANYYGDFLTAEKASLTIMLNSDRDHAFLLNADKAEAELENLSALIAANRATPPAYPLLSNHSIVFLGDSVIGAFDGTTSIPGVVEGLTDARVFNLGLGGGTATKMPDNNCALPDIVNALVNQDTSALPLDMEVSQDAQLHENLSSYLAAEPSKELCFVINYGLNDYFSGLPVTSEDSHDIYTYEGAIRSSVQTLQEAFPNARILLMTPNFTTYYSNGTEYRFEATHVLKDYADALVSLSEELDVELLDNYNELGINAQNHPTYLNDGCHPNELGRFRIGQRIAVQLGNSN